MGVQLSFNQITQRHILLSINKKQKSAAAQCPATTMKLPLFCHMLSRRQLSIYSSPFPAAPPPPSSDHFLYLKDLFSIFTALSNNPRNYKALSTLNSLLSQAHHLDAATSVLVIHALSQLNKLQRAKSLIFNLKSQANLSHYFLYSVVIDSVVKHGTIDEVEAFWADIFRPPTIDVSDYVIYVCKFGDANDIRRVSHRILMGCSGLRQQSYAGLLGALCRENEGVLAKEVLRQMKSRGFRCDDITSFVLFRCFCRNGNLDEADLILRKLVKRRYHIDVCVYGSFIHGLCKSGKFREAGKLFRKLIKKDCFKVDGAELLKEGRRAIFQLNCEGVVPEVMAYEIYFRSLCSAGKLDEAEVLLKKMMKRRTVPEICVHGSFVKALCRAGREVDAMKFFYVERKKGLIQVDELAGFVIEELCGIGKVDDAGRIFHETLANGGFVNPTAASNCILASYWEVGRVAEAEKLFGSMQTGGFGWPDLLTYTTMVSGYCNQGNVSKAVSLFGEIAHSNIPVNGKLYEIIVRGLCDGGQLKEAHMYLNEMIKNGHMISFTRWKALFYSTFVGNKHGFSLGF